MPLGKYRFSQVGRQFHRHLYVSEEEYKQLPRCIVSTSQIREYIKDVQIGGILLADFLHFGLCYVQVKKETI